MRRLMLSHDPPTALFTAQNLITIGAVRALRALDLTQEGRPSSDSGRVPCCPTYLDPR